MAVYWDRCNVTFNNYSNSPMTFSDADATTGFIDGTPTSKVENRSSGTFTGSSTSGSLLGCGGKVVYSLDDGTTVNIRYWTAYPYGPADSSTYFCGFGGPNANRYHVTKNKVDIEGSNGGAGKSVSWTFDIETL